MIIIIAGGILLAFLLLPLLGPIAMIALTIGAIIAMVYAVMYVYVFLKNIGSSIQEASANAKPSFKTTVQSDPEFQQGLADINELLAIKNLRNKPIGCWYSYALKERFRNCSMSGSFRVKYDLNRENMEKYLQKVMQEGTNDTEAEPQANALYQEILALHDSLCKKYPQEAKG